MNPLSSCPAPIDDPYPGLRPFRADEAVIFFGRGEQIDDMLTRLEDRRFLAVVGASGSGKSSLVKAGLIPALHAGYLLGAGTDWLIVDMTPYPSPFGNLAERFEASFAEWSQDESAGDVALKQSLQSRKRPTVGLTQTVLQSGPDGFLEVLHDARVPDDVAVLLVVDQFEEIFKLRKDSPSDIAQRNQTVSFVELLLRTARQSKRPVLVMLTMRSDYLGDCDVFTGLPEEISRSQFLTPRLTREQIREAIVGPLTVFGSTADEALVTQVLNDVGNDSDQLPRMQHALMRTWTSTPHELRSNRGRRLTVETYNDVGGFAAALNRHATEAWNELGDAEFPDLESELQRVARSMFCALSDKGQDGKLTRRKQTIQELADIAGTSVEHVIAAAAAFRRDNRHFVYGVPASDWTAATTLDIGHEAFLRQWDQFQKRFLREEEEAARLYRRLLEMATDWKSDPEAVCREPVLTQAKRWRERKPTPAWAARYRSQLLADRYGPQLSLVNEFLIASEQRATADAQEKKRNILWKLALVGSFVLLVGVGILCTTTIILLNKAERAKAQADEAKELAELKREEAIASKERAEKSEIEAKSQANSAAVSLAKSYLARAELAVVEDRVEDSMVWSLKAFETLPDPKSNWLTKELRQFLTDTKSRQLARNLDPVVIEQRRLFARRQIAWNTLALEAATQSSTFPSALRFSHDGRLVATGFEDGVVKLWETSTGKLVWRVRPLKEKLISFAFSTSGRWLAVGGHGAEVALLDLQEQETLAKLSHPMDSEDQRLVVNRLEFTPTADQLVCGLTTGDVVVWQTKRRSILLRERLEGAILSMSLSRDGSRLACGTNTGSVRVLDLDTGRLGPDMPHPDHEVWEIAFTPDGRQLLTATVAPPNWDRGHMTLWDAERGTMQGEPVAVSTIIHRIGFFPDGRRFVTASQPMKVPLQLWELNSKGPTPVSLLTDQDAFHVEIVESDQRVRILTGRGDRDRTELRWTEFSEDWTPLASFPAVEDDPQNELRQPAPVHAIAIHPQGQVAAVGSGQTRPPSLASKETAARQTGWLKLWNLQTGQEMQTVLDEHPAEILSVVYSFDGQLLAAGDSQGTVLVYGLGERPLVVSHEPPQPVRALTFLPNDLRLLAAFGSEDGERGDLRCWRLENGTAVPLTIEEPPSKSPPKSVVSIAASRDGRLVAVGRGDGSAGIFQVEPAQLKESRRWNPGETNRSPGGLPLDAATDASDQTSQSAIQYNSSGSSRPTYRSRAVWGVAFNEAGDLLFTAGGVPGTSTANIRRWDVNSGAEVGRRFFQPSLIYSLAPLSGGSLIAAACDDQSIGIWDVRLEKSVGLPWRRKGFFESIALHPDGHTLLVGGASGVVHRLVVPPPATDETEFLNLSVKTRTKLKYDADEDSPVPLSNDELDAAKKDLKQRFGLRRGDLRLWSDAAGEQP